MEFGDEIFEAVNFADGNREHKDHREAGVNCASNEVGREDGRMPAGNDADGKIKTYYRVNREHERRSQSSQKKIGSLIAVPVARGSAPAQGKRAIDQPGRGMSRAIAQGCKVGNQTYKPKQG